MVDRFPERTVSQIDGELADPEAALTHQTGRDCYFDDQSKLVVLIKQHKHWPPLNKDIKCDVLIVGEDSPA